MTSFIRTSPAQSAIITLSLDSEEGTQLCPLKPLPHSLFKAVPLKGSRIQGPAQNKTITCISEMREHQQVSGIRAMICFPVGLVILFLLCWHCWQASFVYWIPFRSQSRNQDLSVYCFSAILVWGMLTPEVTDSRRLQCVHFGATQESRTIRTAERALEDRSSPPQADPPWKDEHRMW